MVGLPMGWSFIQTLVLDLKLSSTGILKEKSGGCTGDIANSFSISSETAIINHFALWMVFLETI
jgi:hypothetical protein